MIIITLLKTLNLYFCNVKLFFSIAIIVGLLSSSFGKLLIYTNYLLNKEQITLKYCENKSRPSLKCNGKCHLKKQLKEQEKNEEHSKNNIKDDNEIQLFSNDYYLKLQKPIISKPSLNIQYLSGSVKKLSRSIFHPPTC